MKGGCGWILYPLFFASGTCALSYEVVWTRVFTLTFGVSVYAVSAVLAAFMGGLALGSFAFGRIADRSRNAVRLYGLIEGAIGLYAFVLVGLFKWLEPVYVFLYRHLIETPWLLHMSRFAVAAALLLVPTTLMGATLPVLTRYFVRRPGQLGRSVGVLYFLNTAGAVAGCLIVGFIALQYLGIRSTLYVAAGANVLIGLAAVAVARPEAPGWVVPAEAVADHHNRPEVGQGELRVPMWLLLVMFALAGMASLSYEVLWTRILLAFLHNSVYAFSAMLSTLLVGIALGSLVFARKERRSGGLVVFGLVEISIAAWVAVSTVAVNYIGYVTRALSRRVTIDSWTDTAAIMFGITGFMILPATLLMGYAFPLAVKIAHRAWARVGGHVGTIYAVNTFGAIVGSVATGFLLVPWLGVRNSLLAIICLNVLIGAAAILLAPGLRPPAKALFCLACLGAVTLFQQVVPPTHFQRMYTCPDPETGKPRFEIVFYKEEATDTVMVTERRGRGVASRLIRFSDGRGTAGIVTDPYNRMYAHIPMLVHPHPRSALCICFGVGNTLSAMAAHDVERVDCVELSPGVIEAAAFFYTNKGVLKDPKVKLYIEDGRNFLLGRDEKYDVIGLEPPEMHTSTVVNLYTVEFYRLCRKALNPRGLLCHWMNAAMMPKLELKMLIATCLAVFPHTTLWEGGGGHELLLLASDAPLRVDLAGFCRRFREPRVQEDLKGIGHASMFEFLAHFVWGERQLREYAGEAELVTDDRTYVDFSVPRSVFAGYGLAHFNSCSLGPEDIFADWRELSAGGRAERQRILAARESILPCLTNTAPVVVDRDTLAARLDAAITERNRDERPWDQHTQWMLELFAE